MFFRSTLKKKPPSFDKRGKLIIGLISGQAPIISKTINILEKKYGALDIVSNTIDFNHTDYYEKEFGHRLKRTFLTFKKIIPIECAYRLKLYTGTIENSLSSGSKRLVNIDPGYLTLDKLVLLTTKNYSHRIYLKKGIYAEVTLKYEGTTFVPWHWTYPDYRTKEYIDFFNKVRETYKRSLK